MKDVCGFEGIHPPSFFVFFLLPHDDRVLSLCNAWTRDRFHWDGHEREKDDGDRIRQSSEGFDQTQKILARRYSFHGAGEGGGGQEGSDERASTTNESSVSQHVRSLQSGEDRRESKSLCHHVIIRWQQEKIPWQFMCWRILDMKLAQGWEEWQWVKQRMHCLQVSSWEVRRQWKDILQHLQHEHLQRTGLSTNQTLSACHQNLKIPWIDAIRWSRIYSTLMLPSCVVPEELHLIHKMNQTSTPCLLRKWPLSSKLALLAGLFNTAPQTIAHEFAVTDSLCDLMVNHVAVQIQTAAIVSKTTCRLY